MLRTSERKSFQTCQQQWWWAWREGLVPRGQASDPLWFGIGIHEAFAAWYCGPGTKRGPHPAETWLKYAEDSITAMRVDAVNWDDDREKTWVDLKTLGLVLMEEYVKFYGRDEHKLYIQPEMKFNLPIPWPSDQKLYEPVPNGLLCRYLGTTDGVWRHADTGQIWLDEHKTGSHQLRRFLYIDNQAGSYWAILPRFLQDMGLLKPKEAIAGIEYNFIRKALPDDRPKNAQGYYTNKPTKAHYLAALEEVWRPSWHGGVAPPKNAKLEELVALAERYGLTVLGDISKIQPPPLFDRVQVDRTGNQRRVQLIRIQQDMLHMTAVKDGVLPVTKSPDGHCGWCSFNDMCELQEQGGNWEDYKKAAFVVRDPYADHR